MRILIVEDEADLADSLAAGLRNEGYLVDVALDGAAALVRVGQVDVDIMILDRDLPVLRGDAVCRTLRDQAHPLRILMLTAAGTLDDRVAGLDLGADDYLAKPFAYVELLARLRALARRATESTGSCSPSPGYGSTPSGGSPNETAARCPSPPKSSACSSRSCTPTAAT